MSSTAGGGGGGGGGTGFAGFLAVAGGFGFAFELPAAGFFVVVAGLAVDVCATDTDASAHAATRAAASFEARERQACMGADSTHAPARRLRNAFRPFAGQLALVEICDVHHPKAVVDQAYGPPIAPEAPGAITRKSSSSTSLQR
jgi:hypothetical protein